ncbi:MAG: flagellar hook capping FlgD N-terminal domain-containing protein [Pseudomonadota bacterium]
METTPLPAILDTPGATTSSGESTLTSDYEDFLTLLTTQLENQDPLQPIESTEFVAQLATFSSVEQLVQSNEHLAGIAASLAADDATALAGWIGRHGADAGGRFVATGAPVDVDVPALAGAGSAEAVLRDAEGAELARLPAVPGAPLSVPASLTGEHAGKTLTLSIAYETAAEVEGEPVIVERPAVVLSEIVAVAGSTEGAVLRRADGLELPPERIAVLAPADG